MAQCGGTEWTNVAQDSRPGVAQRKKIWLGGQSLSLNELSDVSDFL